MSTAPRSVAVVATRLPTTDRRALSQAWYSALHVAEQRASAAPAGSGGARATATAPPATVPARARAPQTPARLAGNSARLSRTAGSTMPALSAERRAPASDLARRIERALERRLPPAVQRSTALAIVAPEGRVQLLVRTDGETTRLIAVCAPHLRERVDRALAQVRFTLAGSGTHVTAARG